MLEIPRELCNVKLLMYLIFRHVKLCHKLLSSHASRRLQLSPLSRLLHLDDLANFLIFEQKVQCQIPLQRLLHSLFKLCLAFLAFFFGQLALFCLFDVFQIVAGPL